MFRINLKVAKHQEPHVQKQNLHLSSSLMYVHNKKTTLDHIVWDVQNFANEPIYELFL